MSAACQRQTRFPAACFFAVLVTLATAPAALAVLDPWVTYRNDRHGVQIAYPSGLLKPAPGPASEDGQLFTSQDRRVRLLIGVIPNDDNESLASYREYVKKNTFAGATFDYMPSGQRWFVLSGKQGDMHFYQWVTFMCAGKRIASWVLTYPDAERAELDKVVERMAKTFRPSGGRECE